MTDNSAAQSHMRPGRGRTWLAVLAILLVLLTGLGWVGVKLYLASPLATRQLSRLLTEQLGQPVMVAGLALDGGTLRLHGLVLGNAAGVTGPPLVACQLLEVAPAWCELLRGRKRLAAIRLVGLAATLQQDRAGTWNFDALQRRFAGRKGTGAELLVDRLAMENSTLRVNGQGVQGLRLLVTDLASKGTRQTAIALSGRDGRQNSFTLEGRGRLGEKPEFELTGAVPAFALAALQQPGSALNMAKGQVAAHLQAALRDGVLTAAAQAQLRDVSVTLKNAAVPLDGSLGLAASYRLADDSLTLQRCRVEVNRLLRLNGQGTVRGVKGERAFQGELRWERLQLAQLLAQLPVELRRELLVAGVLQPGVIQMAGSRDGLSRVNGSLSLTGGRVAKAGKPLVENLAAELAVARQATGWLVSGALRAAGSGSRPLLETLTMPLAATFDRRFRLQQAIAPALTARLLGATATGSLRYAPAMPMPLQGSLQVDRLALAELGRFFPGPQLVISDGTGSIGCTLSGALPAELTATASVKLAGLRGIMAGKTVALASGALTGSFSQRGKLVRGEGQVALAGGLLAATPLAGEFAYRLADGQATLAGVRVVYGKQTLRLAELSGPLPPARPTGAPLPLRLHWSGLAIADEALAVGNGQGSLDADLYQAGSRCWLKGTGQVTLAEVALRGKPLGTLGINLIIKEKELAARVTGRLLGGSASASFLVDPFAVREGGRFAVTLTDLDAARLPDLWHSVGQPQLAGGHLTLSGSGDYTPRRGVAAQFVLYGSALAVVDKKGRSLLTDGTLILKGDLRDGTFRLQEGKVGLPGEVVVTGTGEVRKVFAADREGLMVLRLAATPLTSIFDTLANQLPRALQEAEVAGTLAGSVNLALKGKALTVEGITECSGVKLEVPSRKLSITQVRGRLPFSLDLAGTAGTIPRSAITYSREHYSRLLAAFPAGSKKGEALRVGRVRFGSVDLTDVVLRVRAGYGVTEITSLEALLYQGRLLGHGCFRLKNGAQYGGDLLASDLSLRALCDTAPAIKGYISGKVDGIVSLFGDGAEIGNLNGFVDLWTRNGKGEKMLVSKEFLQKLAGKKLKGVFFRTNRAFDKGEISAYLENGDLTFDRLDVSHTNFFGIRDLSVSVAAVQNRIGLEHLLTVVQEASALGKAAGTGGGAPIETEFKWQE